MKTSLYNGEVEIEFKDSGHRYSVNGKPVKGVTTILAATVAKPFLMTWAANLAVETFRDTLMAHFAGGGAWDGFDPLGASQLAKTAHTRKKEAGADTGTLVHDWIEGYLKGNMPLPPTDPQALLCVESFLGWEIANKPHWLYSEKLVYSRQHDYCGTIDAGAVIAGKVARIDFKTSDPKKEWKNNRPTGKLEPYPEHWLQIGGYEQADAEESNVSADEHRLLYIQKNGLLAEFVSNKVTLHAEGFVAAKTYHDKLQKITWENSS